LLPVSEAAALPVVRVLVVDDHAMFASSIALALEREPGLHVVGTASTLAEARRMVVAREPDLLLVDHRLPDGLGAAAIPELKRRRPSLRVVLMSAAVDDGALVSAIENGASGFLSKSASVEELVQALHAAAAGEVLVSPALLARLLPRVRQDSRRVPFELTPREVQIVAAFSRGCTNQEIADELGISVNTVRNHVQNLLAKLGVHSKLEALALAVREGIVTPSQAP
jgi:DNA-binding NarL/FixJ family response regulator